MSAGSKQPSRTSVMFTLTASAGTFEAICTLEHIQYLFATRNRRTYHLLYAGVSVSGRSRKAYRICPQLQAFPMNMDPHWNPDTPPRTIM